MSDIVSLSVPVDAKILTEVTDGQAAELFRRAKQSEADLRAALRAVADWRSLSLAARMMMILKGVAARRRVNAMSVVHDANVKAFKDNVQSARTSEAYQKAVKKLSVPTPGNPSHSKPTPAAVTEAPPDRTVTREASVPPTTAGNRSFYLTVTPPEASLASLFKPRMRPSPIKSVPGKRLDEKIYLPIGDDKRELAVAAGALVGPRGGVFVPALGDLDPFDRWLPFFARRLITPLNVDLIPTSNFGASLANLLTTSSWRAIRAPVMAKTGGKCIICGFGGVGREVDCHEIWKYYRPLRGYVGVQKLVSVLPVCGPCHSMFHLGKAQIDGRFDTTLERLEWANRWTEDETENYLEYMSAKHNDRSQMQWILDLSLVGSIKLVLKGGKTGVSIGDDGDLQFTSATGAGVTRIIGASYGHKDQASHKSPRPVDYSQYVED